jgi:hypothetical protein
VSGLAPYVIWTVAAVGLTYAISTWLVSDFTNEAELNAQGEYVAVIELDNGNAFVVSEEVSIDSASDYRFHLERYGGTQHEDVKRHTCGKSLL